MKLFKRKPFIKINWRGRVIISDLETYHQILINERKKARIK